MSFQKKGLVGYKKKLKRADKIIAVSKQTKKDIINYFSIDEQKIEVVYQGCNKIFQSKISEEKIDYIKG